MTRTDEIIVENYMQALLKAALLLGDLHRAEAVHKVTISGYYCIDHTRILQSRCIILHKPSPDLPEAEDIGLPPVETDYLILYPLPDGGGAEASVQTHDDALL